MYKSIIASLIVFLLTSCSGPQKKREIPSLLAEADSLASKHDYETAIAVGKRALEAIEREYGANDTASINIICKLAIWYDIGIADLHQSESYWILSLNIREQVFGPDHFEAARSLNNLAILNWKIGRLREAVSMYERSLNIISRSPQANDTVKASVMANLATVYHTDGMYAKAERLYTEVLEIRRDILDPNHLDIARVLNNLAVLYLDERKYAKAKEFYERAISIKRSNLGDDHPEVASSILNLATLLERQGNYAQAESLLRKSLSIFRKTLGEEHVNYAKACLALANTCSTQKRYGEAREFALKALHILEKILGEKHPDVAAVLTTLAQMSLNQGDLNGADTLFMKVLDIRQKSITNNHPRTAASLGSLARLRFQQARPEEAVRFADLSYHCLQSHFDENAIVFPERDALKYSRILRDGADLFFSLFLPLPSNNMDEIRNALMVVLKSKGIVSDAVFERKKAIIRESDSSLRALAEDLRLNTFYLSQLFVSGPGENVREYRRQIDSLRNRKDEIERELSRRSASYRQQHMEVKFDINRIISLLPEKAALIEYLRYDYVDIMNDTVKPCYLAAVIGADSSLAIVDLGEAAECDSLIRAYRSHMLRISSQNGRITPEDMTEYRKISRRIRDYVWGPIEQYVKETDLILIGPDGFLNFVSFAGLQDGEGRYLIEDQSIHYLSAGRDLMRFDEHPHVAQYLLALGDPDFDASVAERTPIGGPENDENQPRDSYRSRGIPSNCNGFGDLLLGRLPKSRKEVESITGLWREASDDSIVVCLGNRASEDMFKAWAPRNRLIHVATHGYFFDNQWYPETDNEGAGNNLLGSLGDRDNPLLLSGLFCAGANHHGRGADSARVEDGILTAYEVASMNLTGTMIVVLSACETGLGEVMTGEGVYGLRRAFQIAGARTVICSLWPISDRLASVFFTNLYNREGSSLADLLRDLQREEIIHLRQEGEPDHPFTWGPYIALGDWRNCPRDVVAHP